MSDLRRVEGALASVSSGGRIRWNHDETMTYLGGHPPEVAMDVIEGTAVPLDRGGLILWSFYAHLEDLAGEMEALGLSPDSYFPISAAHSPIVPDLLLSMAPVSNAAYATGGHIFILLPDVGDDALPAAANAGIVRHEFGHCLFHLATAGDLYAPSPFELVDTSAEALYYSSLHEGFSDAFAALTLDDPFFMEASYPSETARDLRGDLRIEDVETPEQYLGSEDEGPLGDLLALWDPYPVGTVVASVAWDAREATGEPQLVARSLLDGVALQAQEAGDQAAPLGSLGGFLSAWVRGASDEPALQGALCTAISNRLSTFLAETPCGR